MSYYNWSVEIVNVDGNFRKAVYNKETEDIIFVADIFAEDFVNSIVDKHNEQVSIAYSKGLDDGAVIKRGILLNN
ncbi:MAG: hypothetical protein Q8910_00160 [Bacteroidota bacterium]|nr:hypothetical protein [Bacteroidota bacterium]